MRTGGVTYYLFPDHLGSTHITVSSVNGAELGRLLYCAASLQTASELVQATGSRSVKPTGFALRDLRGPS